MHSPQKKKPNDPTGASVRSATGRTAYLAWPSCARLNAADKNGDTALIIATTESSDEVFRSLLDKGANPNARSLNGKTVLHYAAMNAILDRAKLLLSQGADPSIYDSAGKLAYDDAEKTNPDKSVQVSTNAKFTIGSVG